jgi:hypothetical protein
MDDKVYGDFPAAAAAFAENTLQGSNQPRDYYEEFLNLTISLLQKASRWREVPQSWGTASGTLDE